MTSITGQQHTALLAETYYKAVRPDGTDFYSGVIAWDQMGEIVRHPNPGIPGGGDAKSYLSVSVSPADCTGMKWPCRLLVVEPVEGVPVWEPTPGLPSKRASHAWRVVRELPAHEALGPNGAEVAAFLELLPTLTSPQWSAAWFAASVAAGDAASVAARSAAWDAAWVAARGAARDAAWALVVRDLISTDHFDVLTAPMRAVGIDFDALAEAYHATIEAEETQTPDTPALWRDSDREEWRREGPIYLELVGAPYVTAGISRGGTVLIDDDSETVAVPPEHLPALIAMLQEVQRRIGGASC